VGFYPPFLFVRYKKISKINLLITKKKENMNKTQKKELYKNITAHGDNLKKLFKLDNSVDSVKLCKSLLRLENKAQKLALDYC
jgi:hypothetical protein